MLSSNWGRSTGIGSQNPNEEIDAADSGYISVQPKVVENVQLSSHYTFSKGILSVSALSVDIMFLFFDSVMGALLIPYCRCVLVEQDELQSTADICGTTTYMWRLYIELILVLGQHALPNQIFHPIPRSSSNHNPIIIFEVVEERQ